MQLVDVKYQRSQPWALFDQSVQVPLDCDGFSRMHFAVELKFLDAGEDSSVDFWFKYHSENAPVDHQVVETGVKVVNVNMSSIPRQRLLSLDRYQQLAPFFDPNVVLVPDQRDEDGVPCVVDRGTNEKVSNMRSLHIVGGSFMCRDAKEDGAYILMQLMIVKEKRGKWKYVVNENFEWRQDLKRQCACPCWRDVFSRCVSCCLLCLDIGLKKDT